MKRAEPQITSPTPDPLAERWWITQFANDHRGQLIGVVMRRKPGFPEHVVSDTLDYVTDRATQLPATDNPLGFDPSKFDNPEAGLFDWLAVRTVSQMRTPERQSALYADVTPEQLEAVVADNGFEDQLTTRHMIGEVASLSEEARTLAQARADGVPEIRLRERGFNWRFIERGEAELADLRQRFAAFGPIPFLVALFRRGGSETTATAGGVATAGGATIGTKVLAGCVAGVVCVGTGAGAIAVQQNRRHDPKPAATTSTPSAARSEAPTRLFTPIKSSAQSIKKKQAAQAARKRSAARKRRAAQREARQVESEFGIETPSSTSTSSGTSSGSSSAGSGKGNWSGEFAP